MMSVAKPYTLTLLVAAVLYASGLAHAQAGLTEENIRNFYNEMTVMNTTLEEGFEDLHVFLAYLDRTLTDDFRHISKFHEQCAAVPAEGTVITKEQLLNTYKDIGIDNFDTYELDLQTIKIGEDRQTAEIRYTLHIEDAGGAAPFMTTCNARASLIWDVKHHTPRIAEQACEQSFTLGTEKKTCEKPE